jgi:type VII secretion protein EccB
VPARQDQLQSHQFSTQRVVAALLTQDTDPARSPFRRTAGATFAGVLLAVVALAGAAVYGLFTGPGPDSWRDASAILVEKESGARYVYRKADDRLHPVLNYASALLLVGSPDAHVVLISRATLAKAPLGAPLGIPDAPDSLPARGELRSGSWTLCSTPDGSALLVGVPVRGGHPVGVPQGLLVSTVDGDRFLVYDGKRHRIPHPETALAALGWSGRQPVPVAPVLVNALPAGPDLRPPVIPNRGRPSTTAAGAKIGQLFGTAGHQYAVALADGVADLTEVQAALLLADPATPGPAIALTTAQYAALRRSSTGLVRRDTLPANTPELTGPAKTVCVNGTTVLVDPVLPDGGLLPTGDDARVDRVLVPRGSGALVEAAAAPNAPSGTGTLTIVTDSGVGYPLANPDLLGPLGYGGVTPQRVPAALVALLPTGPALDPAAPGLAG